MPANIFQGWFDMEVLEQARKKKQGTLSEYDSKKLLKEYGIPVTEEVIIKGQKDAVDKAAEIGYPVVLKACGAGPYSQD